MDLEAQIVVLGLPGRHKLAETFVTDSDLDDPLMITSFFEPY